MPENRFYEEEEAQKILRMASESHFGGGMSREEMLRAAEEAGIPRAAIEEAELKYLQQGTAKSMKEEYRLHSLRRIQSEVGRRIGLFILLGGINFLTSHRLSWSLWPIGILTLLTLKDVVEIIFGRPWEDPDKVERWSKMRERRSARAAASD